MEIGSTQAIKSAVEAGLGVSILSKLTVARELEKGYLHKVDTSRVKIDRGFRLI